MEGVVMDKTFWQGKKVLITGHTGFKGSWLVILLNSLGADVAGYALSPNKEEDLFNIAQVSHGIYSVIGDVRDYSSLLGLINKFKPEIVIHMAAQALVRESYLSPVDTYSTNVMGTVNLFECVRHTTSVRSVVNVTTDKCYENNEWIWGYRETDRLGGKDPYSSSKACAEIVTHAYRTSFFGNSELQPTIGISTARAGNVIGGGDWSKDRLIPDIIRAFNTNQHVNIRFPNSIRPWQHVLDPLNGYLMLAKKLYLDPKNTKESYNFGPADDSALSVQQLVERIKFLWGSGSFKLEDPMDGLHEAAYLKLDISQAKSSLHWNPLISIDDALAMTIGWYKNLSLGKGPRQLMEQQINSFLEADNNNEKFK